MPRTRAQRQRALAKALDGDSVSYILSFLPKLGVVPGRLSTLSGSGTQLTCGGLSLKSILAPRRRPERVVIIRRVRFALYDVEAAVSVTRRAARGMGRRRVLPPRGAAVETTRRQRRCPTSQSPPRQAAWQPPPRPGRRSRADA